MPSSSLDITGANVTIDGSQQRARRTMRGQPPPILQKAYVAFTKGVTGQYLLVFLYIPVETGTHNALKRTFAPSPAEVTGLGLHSLPLPRVKSYTSYALLLPATVSVCHAFV
jgi:hypothetical protein